MRLSCRAVIAPLQSRLAAAASPSTKQWWERYLKGAIEFRGVPMAGIRSALHDWLAADGAPEPSVGLAGALIREPVAEDKLAGILLLQEVLVPAGALNCDGDLGALAGLFDEGAIADWNTCDWFCVRVLGPLANRNGEPCARAIAGWSGAANVWRSRAAGVAFVNLAPAGDANFPGFTEMLLAACEQNVGRPESFAQTGVGWVLRELSRAEPDRVAGFVRRHQEKMSREAIRSAVRKLPDGIAAELLDAHGR